MCQLTLVNVNQRELAKQLLTLLLINNTKNDHHDGVGMTYHISKDGQPSRYRRVHLTPPYRQLNFYDTFTNVELLPKYPIVAHVRKAATAFSKKEKDDDELREQHLHPFISSDRSLILAHNGTLYFQDGKRDKKAEKEFPDMIDSQIFLEVFAKEYEKSKKAKLHKNISTNVVEALNSAMKEFYGKFAFLIEEMNTNKVYIVRGKATLFRSEISINDKPVGFVVNTEFEGLRDSLHLLVQIWKQHKNAVLTYTVPNPLEEETIYEVKGKSLEVIGEAKQNVKVSPKVTNQSRKALPAHTSPANQHAQSATGIGTAPTLTTKTPVDTALRLVERQMKQLGDISFYEYDQLLQVFTGTGLTGVTPKILRYFTTIFVKPTLAFLEESGQKKTLFKRWRKIRKNTYTLWDARGNYRLFPDLQFPFMFTSEDTLHSIECLTRKKGADK
jgi:predicted glutamine amidotransferase